MAYGDSTYQIIGVTHGGVNLGEVLGADVDDNVDFLSIKALESVFDQVAPIVGRSMQASVSTLQLDDNINPGVKATLTISLREADGGAASVAITNMQRGTVSRAFDNPPYTKKVSFSNYGDPVITVSI